MSGERGIVVTFQMPNKSLIGTIDPVELRRHLLYWDFIDFPVVNKITKNFAPDEDANLLKEQGFIRQTHVEFPNYFPDGKIIGDDRLLILLLKGQYKVFEMYNKQNIPCTISQYNVDLEVPQDLQKEMAILEMNLINCLPSPNANTRMVDIIEFKEKRKDELIRLRVCLDEIYLTAAKDPDKFRSEEFVKQKMNIALGDLYRLFTESKISTSLSSVKVLIKLGLLVYGGYKSGGELAKLYNLPILETSIAGAIGAAAIKFEPKKIMGPKRLPENLSEFAYLYNAIRTEILP